MSRTSNALVARMRLRTDPVPLERQLETRGGRGTNAWLPSSPRANDPVTGSPPAAPIDPALLAEAREEARREAEHEGLLSAQTRIETLAQRYLDAIADLEQAVRATKRPNADEVVDLALTLAQEIVGHECMVDRGKLIETVESVLQTTEDKRGVIIRLGKADFAYVTQRRPDLPGIFVADEGLTVGSCVIETPREVHDLTVERRLAAMRDALREALTGGDESAADSDVEDVAPEEIPGDARGRAL